MSITDETTTRIPAMRRTRKEPRHRPWAVFDATTGSGTLEGGQRFEMPTRGALAGMLSHFEQIARAHGWPRLVVYLLTGPYAPDAPAQDWYKQPAAEGWRVDLRWEQPARRTATYALPGFTLELRHSQAWDDGASTAGIAQHLGLLRERIRQIWPGADLWATPAQTGMDLLERSLPFDREYPILPDETRALIHRISPQGRLEFFPPATPHLMRYCYFDCRFAYVTRLRHLPTYFPGSLTIDEGGEFLAPEPGVRYRPGWYRVTVKVPDEWAHVGLLPLPHPDGERWLYPNRAGQAFETWASGCELMLAKQHGWRFIVHQRILFAPVDTPGADPLATWQKNLVGVWDREPGLRPQVRHLVLDTIGSLARRSASRLMIVPVHELGNAAYGEQQFDPRHPPVMGPFGWEVREQLPLPTQLAGYQHPEWAAWIWAQQRASLTRAALSLRPEDVLALRVDALALTRDPGWPDDGKPGRYRLKGSLVGPLDAPRGHADILRLNAQAEAMLALEKAASNG